MMRITILFGGTNKERLVSVASAQALHAALPEADLWFWDADDTVHEVAVRGAARACAAVRGSVQARHAAARRHRAGARQGQGRGSRCWCSACMAAGRRTANCRRCAKCAASPSPAPARRPRISPSTRSRPSALPRSPASRRRPASRWKISSAALAEYGRLIAKPARDGSSYGLIFVNAKQDLVAVRNAAKTEEYLIEPFIAGVEATCGVLEQLGRLGDRRCRRSRSSRRRARFDYTRQISRQVDPGDLPGPLFARDHRRRSWIRRCGRTGRCRAAAIPAPISSSRRRGRSISKPIPCRA